MDYLGLNVRVNILLEKRIKFEADESVSFSVSAMKSRVKNMLVKEQFPNELIDAIFIKERIIEEDFSDEDYLKFLLEETNYPLLQNIKQIYLDYYTIEHVLRRGQFPKIISKELDKLIKSPSDNLSSVIFKSTYYKSFQHLKIDNYRKLFDEYLYDFLKPYQHQSIGIEGIVARVIRWNLRIENDAIEEKARRFNIDGSASVREYND